MAWDIRFKRCMCKKAVESEFLTLFELRNAKKGLLEYVEKQKFEEANKGIKPHKLPDNVTA